MILDQLMKPLTNLLYNPLFAIVILAVGGAGILLLIVSDTMKKAYEVWYFSEPERIIDVLRVERRTPKQLKIFKENLRFIRNSVAYTLRRGAKTVIVWLGKRGTAYTWKPAQPAKDKEGKPLYERVGTLWDGLVSCLGEDAVKGVDVETMQKLVESKIFVTVELEEGLTPPGYSAMSEQDIHTEANNDMAGLIGVRIRTALQEINWIEKIALMGSGGLAVLLLQGLGIIPAFNI